MSTETKPGITTTEFWMTLATAAVGLFLIVFPIVTAGEDGINWEVLAIGAGMVGISIPTYAIGRSKVKSGGACLLPFVLCLSLAGCQILSTEVSTDSIFVTTDCVVARHNSYVGNDTTLDDTDRDLFITDGHQLMRMLTELESIPRETLFPLLIPICDRHDIYVKADTLSDLERRIYLRSTEFLRGILGEGE